MNTSAIEIAIKDENKDELQRLLDSGVSIETRLTFEKPPLLFAVEFAKINIVKLLLDRGANTEARDKNGKTALMYATDDDDKNHQTICKMLISAGANINQQDSTGKTALIHAVLINKTGSPRINIVKLLLSYPECDVNLFDTNYLTAELYTDADTENPLLQQISELLQRRGSKYIEDPLFESYKRETADFPFLYEVALRYSHPLRWIIDRSKSDKTESIFLLMVGRKDWKNLKLLLSQHLHLQIQKILSQDQLWTVLRNTDPIIFGKTRVPVPLSEAPYEGIIDDESYGFTNKTAMPDSPAASVWLIPKTNPDIQVWMEEQGKYLSDARNRTIVKAYTYRGDRLLNLTSRGDTRILYHILDAIKTDSSDKNPLIVQLYELYDEFQRRGYVSLPDKGLLINEDGSYNSEEIHNIFINNYDRIKQKSMLFTLIERFRRDLYKVIKNAPRMLTPLLVFRGTKNDKLLEAGAFSYTTNYYSSTSLNPEVTHIFTQKDWYGTNLHGFILEIEIKEDTPCIYLKSVSEFPSEEEVLLPPNIKFIALPYSSIKYDITNHESYYVRHLKAVGVGSIKNNVLYSRLHSKTEKRNTTVKSARNKLEKNKSTMKSTMRKNKKTINKKYNKTRKLNKYYSGHTYNYNNNDNNMARNANMMNES